MSGKRHGVEGKSVRDELIQKFGLTKHSAHFAFLQATKTAEDKRADWERYQASGFRAAVPGAKAGASRMVHNDNFQAAVAYTRKALGCDETEHGEELDGAAARRRSLERLTNYAQGNLGRILGGELILNREQWEGLSDQDRALISEVTVTTRKAEGGDLIETVKLKLEPRLAAEARLAKLGGWDEPEKTEDVTRPEVLQARARLEEAIERRRRRGKGSG